MSETEYVSQMLTKIKRFAQHHDVHVWFVAHPRQLRDWKGQPPTMYDISGSAHFINKADNGLVIHRNRDPQAGPMNEVSPCIDRQALDMSENACQSNSGLCMMIGSASYYAIMMAVCSQCKECIWVWCSVAYYSDQQVMCLGCMAGGYVSVTIALR